MAKPAGRCSSMSDPRAEPFDPYPDVPTTPVGPFHVANRDTAGLLEDVQTLLTKRREPAVACALHVGGLNSGGDETFVRAMNRADLLYADGAAVVLLAKL